jgi:ABC-type multidrug transport system fused ATPase/permease subunit
MVYRYISMYETTYSANTIFIIIAGLMGGALISNLLKLILHAVSLISANIKTHEEMLSSLCQCPVSFFDTTPSGRIVNRFSSDKSLQDYVLHILFTDVYEL